MNRQSYGFTEPIALLKMIKSVCDCLGYGKNQTAHLQLIETTIVETDFGNHYDPTKRAGMGITQIDEKPFIDVLDRTSKRIYNKVSNKLFMNLNYVSWEHLRYTPYLGELFTRLFYRLRREPIPLTVLQRSSYWKTFYNTKSGKGKTSEYIEKVHKWYDEKNLIKLIIEVFGKQDLKTMSIY